MRAQMKISRIIKHKQYQRCIVHVVGTSGVCRMLTRCSPVYSVDICMNPEQVHTKKRRNQLKSIRRILGNPIPPDKSPCSNSKPAPSPRRILCSPAKYQQTQPSRLRPAAAGDRRARSGPGPQGIIRLKVAIWGLSEFVSACYSSYSTSV